jgi:heme-degrading monooxygenase HmoA
MITAFISHTVADYAKWRERFDANEPTRRAAGATGVKQVYRDLEDPNRITVLIEWDSAENAQRFFQDPKTKELMAAAGVVSVLDTHLLNRA